MAGNEASAIGSMRAISTRSTPTRESATATPRADRTEPRGRSCRPT
jgi:hypothetical protein